jgi:hypothetical protein
VKNALCFILIFFIFLSSRWLEAVNLVDVYKQGEIILAEDPDFGKNVDWESLFYDIGKELTIGPDGIIYVTNAQQDNIFKFSKEGQFLLQFGQKGQGPLDFYGPGRPSILDNKYLVVTEHPENRKITLVDLAHIDTEHVKVLKTNYNPWMALALKDNKIAYAARKNEYITKWDLRRILHVIIKDVITGKEKKVASYEYRYYCRSFTVTVFFNTFLNYFGNVYIARTKDGNLITGSSDHPYIEIFSPEGKKIKSFDLGYQPLPLTDKRKKELMDRWGDSFRSNTPEGRRRAADFKNTMKGSRILGDHLTYYDYLMTDSEGNILVFPSSHCWQNCEIRFRVYSPEGRYICTTRLNTGKFKFENKYPFERILFTTEGIFGLFELKDSEDISLRLVRVKLKSKHG